MRFISFTVWFSLVLFVLSLVHLMIGTVAQEDSCLKYYGFNDESDMPGENEHFKSNGWTNDKISNSYVSTDKSQGSEFSIELEGPQEISFEWNVSTEKHGVGVLQLQIDRTPVLNCNSENRTNVTRSIPAGHHTIKWVVFRGSQLYTACVDSICIRKIPCTEPCPSAINNKPVLSHLISDVLSPQEAGTTIVWTAEADDSENDEILYRFFLKSQPVTDWQPQNQWTWETTQQNVGDNQIEVRVIDGKHSGRDSFDESETVAFEIVSPNRVPSISRLSADRPSQQEAGSVIIWIAEASDSENDQILYQFWLNNQIIRDWSADNKWTWTTTTENVGDNRVEVRIIDGKHAGLDSFDHRETAAFVVKARNQPPVIISLGADGPSPQVAGTTIVWTAEASDLESDPILYRFLLNGHPVTDWQPQNQWTWETTEQNVGDNQIEVRVIDGTHAGRGSFDDKATIAFKIVSLNPPTTPEIPLGPDEGFNDTFYWFSITHQEIGNLDYTFDWGDGTTTSTGLVGSNGPSKLPHKWVRAETYSVKVKATDELGRESEWSQAKNIRIDWLVRVPPKVPLQSVINQISNNTTVLLGGRDYDGPLDILNRDHINISSSGVQCLIKTKGDDDNYVIGLQEASNIVINGLNISGDKGIGLYNCHSCKLINNNLTFKSHGIALSGGHDNTMGNNYLDRSFDGKSDGGIVGILLEP